MKTVFFFTKQRSAGQENQRAREYEQDAKGQAEVGGECAGGREETDAVVEGFAQANGDEEENEYGN
jgi:hypothetical protein